LKKYLAPIPLYLLVFILSNLLFSGGILLYHDIAYFSPELKTEPGLLSLLPQAMSFAETPATVLSLFIAFLFWKKPAYRKIASLLLLFIIALGLHGGSFYLSSQFSTEAPRHRWFPFPEKQLGQVDERIIFIGQLEQARPAKRLHDIVELNMEAPAPKILYHENADLDLNAAVIKDADGRQVFDYHSHGSLHSDLINPHPFLQRFFKDIRVHYELLLRKWHTGWVHFWLMVGAELIFLFSSWFLLYRGRWPLWNLMLGLLLIRLFFFLPLLLQNPNVIALWEQVELGTVRNYLTPAVYLALSVLFLLWGTAFNAGASLAREGSSRGEDR